MCNTNKPNLRAFFRASLTKTFGHGEALKTSFHSDDVRERRYFDLKVIDVDDEGVWFEGYSSEASNTRNNRYHGVTYVDLTQVSSYVEACMIAAHQLPSIVDKRGYVKG